MTKWLFNVPTKACFGEGVIEMLSECLPARKVLLVVGRSSAKMTGLLDKVLSLIQRGGGQAVVYEGIKPNPEDWQVEEAAEILKRDGCGAVVGVGGGSVMDASKCIAGLVKSGGKVADYVRRKGKADKRFTSCLPLVLIPTLAGTGSELDPYAVITIKHTREKVVFSHRGFWPKVSLIDPELTYTVPAPATAEGGVDALVHLMETYLTCRESMDVSDGITVSLANTIIEHLPKCLDDPRSPKARRELLWASSLALCGICWVGRDGLFVLHSLEHPLSGVYDIPHGRGLAALLPPFMEMLKDICPERLDLWERNVMTQDELVKWLDRCDIKVRLRDFGVKEDDLRGFVNKALELDGDGECLDGEERMNRDFLLELYRRAM